MGQIDDDSGFHVKQRDGARQEAFGGAGLQPEIEARSPAFKPFDGLELVRSGRLNPVQSQFFSRLATNAGELIWRIFVEKNQITW